MLPAMATTKATKSPEEPQDPQEPEVPTDPEEARAAFLRGEVRWNDYVRVANQ